MNRHPKALQSKSKEHAVEDLGNGIYSVTSGTSGKAYRVNVFGNGNQGAGCSCDWAKYRPDSNKGQCGCSHVIAVMKFREDGRRLAVWASMDDAKRQHAHIINLGDGLMLTSKAA